MSHQRIAIPEADCVAIPGRIGIVGGRVAAPVGVDAADVVHHFVDQPRLCRRDDELVQKGLGKPARGAGRAAVADRIVLATRARHPFRLGIDGLLPGGRQPGRIRPAPRRQIRIELQSAPGARVDARPVKGGFAHLLPGRRLSAARRRPERFEERLGGLEALAKGLQLLLVHGPGVVAVDPGRRVLRRDHRDDDGGQHCGRHERDADAKHGSGSRHDLGPGVALTRRNWIIDVIG